MLMTTKYYRLIRRAKQINQSNTVRDPGMSYGATRVRQHFFVNRLAKPVARPWSGCPPGTQDRRLAVCTLFTWRVPAMENIICFAAYRKWRADRQTVSHTHPRVVTTDPQQVPWTDEAM
jgi:hypothetical protein